MDTVYRTLVPVGLWLGIAAFLLSLVMMLVGQPFLFRLSPGGILSGAQTLFLLAVGAYCALRSTQRT